MDNNEGRNKKYSTNNILTLVMAVLAIIVVFAIAVIVYLWVNGKINFKNIFDNNENEKVELKYTETNNDAIEGIYITDVSEVVEDVMPSIVAITSKTLVSNGLFSPNFYGENQYSEGAGSGIIISKSDSELMILTNNHVVEGAEELSVQFIDGVSVDATVKGTRERKDIAVISIKLKDIPKDTLKAVKIATVGNSDTLKVGNGVIAIGNSLGYGQSVTTGVVSAVNRTITIDEHNYKMIQIDAAINGGNSGGALLNSKGEVVGINSAKYSSGGTSTTASVEGMGFAIPITDVKDLITDLINGEEESQGGVLGIEGYMTNSAQFSLNNLPVGFYISKITNGSGADKAGLAIGNIITGIEEEKVESFSDISDVLYEKKPKDVVTLKIKYVSGKEYKEKEVKVTLS